jgi:hypothetical protein
MIDIAAMGKKSPMVVSPYRIPAKFTRSTNAPLTYRGARNGASPASSVLIVKFKGLNFT